MSSKENTPKSAGDDLVSTTSGSDSELKQSTQNPARPDPRDVHVIFDWDDTLFPSTLVQSMHGMSQPGDLSALDTLAAKVAENPDLFAAFAQLDANINSLLDMVMTLGTAYVITNAEKGWVQQSAFRFLPRTYHCLIQHSIPIVSARTSYIYMLRLSSAEAAALESNPTISTKCLLQGLFRLGDETGSRAEVNLLRESSPDLWKRFTFAGLMNSLISTQKQQFLTSNDKAAFCPPKRQLHFISIGDSESERAAMLRCREQFFPFGYFKTVKLLETPSLSHLLDQQTFLQRNLLGLVSRLGSMDLIVDPTEPKLDLRIPIS